MTVGLEFALNLLWAVVSLALLLESRKSNIHQQGHRAFRAFAAIALICVLFPIISITDDLNSVPALIETRQSHELTSQNQHTSPAGALPALPAIHAITLTPQDQDSISATTKILSHDVFAFNQSRRPPPIFQV